jgi:hypothetical protein
VVKFILKKWQMKMGNIDSGIWGIIIDPICIIFNPPKMANEI